MITCCSHGQACQDDCMFQLHGNLGLHGSTFPALPASSHTNCCEKSVGPVGGWAHWIVTVVPVGMQEARPTGGKSGQLGGSSVNCSQCLRAEELWLEPDSTV